MRSSHFGVWVGGGAFKKVGELGEDVLGLVVE